MPAPASGFPPVARRPSQARPRRAWIALTSTTGAALASAAALGYLVVVGGATMPDWRIVALLCATLAASGVGVGVFLGGWRAKKAAARVASLRDALTGLPNRRHAQIMLEASFSGARAGVPLSLILFDLDRFRWINEEHGHRAGDEVLTQVGGLLRRSLHDGELVGRWGGGEFLVILPGVPLARAVARAEAMRIAVRDAPRRLKPVTVSAGVAAHGAQHPTADGLVSAADEALRRAKERGGDQVVGHAFDGETEGALAVRGAPGAAVADLDPWARPSSNGEAPLLEAHIVVVDDEQPNLRAFSRGLRALGFRHVTTFQDPVAAVEAMEADPPDLVLLDLIMPVMDGFDVLDRMRPLMEREGFLPVVILTGDRNPEVRERALRLGGKDFLNKPVDLTELEARILNLLEARALHRALRDARDRLEERVRERTRELESARVEILRRLARAAEYRDDATGRHQERVGHLAERLAVRMGVDAETVNLLRLAAPLHDLGKIAIPDDILRKPGPLTDDQYAQMKEHTRLGAELLSGSSHQILEVARVVALSHHERWDGKGYPAGRAGEDIPLVGRIVSVADVFDSLLHSRPYKSALPMDQVVAMIHEDAGTAFDPQVVRALDELAAGGMLDDLTAD